MTKKTFRDKTSHLDRFFSDDTAPVMAEAEKPQETHSTYEMPRAYETHATSWSHHVSSVPPAPAAPYYRLNLKLKEEYHVYLANESWKARKSITQYLNDLIQADKDTKRTQDTMNI